MTVLIVAGVGVSLIALFFLYNWYISRKEEQEKYRVAKRSDIASKRIANLASAPEAVKSSDKITFSKGPSKTPETEKPKQELHENVSQSSSLGKLHASAKTDLNRKSISQNVRKRNTQISVTERKDIASKRLSNLDQVSQELQRPETSASEISEGLSSTEKDICKIDSSQDAASTNLIESKNIPDTKILEKKSDGNENLSLPKENRNNSILEKESVKTESDVMREVLSDILLCSVLKQGSGKRGPRSLNLKDSDLPSNEENVMKKTILIVERRFSWETYGQIALCSRSYNACRGCEGRFSGIVASMVACVKQHVIKIILEILKQEDELDVDDGIWAGYSAQKSGGISAMEENEYLSLLARIAGYSDDGVSICHDLLVDIVTTASADPEKINIIKRIIMAGAKALKSTRLDEVTAYHAKTIKGLELLLETDATIALVADIMKEEIEQGKKSLGSYFEHETLLGPLISISTIVPNFKEMTDIRLKPEHSGIPWLNLKGFPKVTRYDLDALESQIQGVIHQVQSVIRKAFVKLFVSRGKVHRPVALSWLGILLSMNEARVNVTPIVHPQKDDIQATCSDGFMLNLVNILLELALPVCVSLSKRKLVSPEYYTSPHCRVNLNNTTCLAGGLISKEEAAGTDDASETDSQSSNFHFNTEIMALTQYALHIGYVPAKSMYNKLNQILERSAEAQPAKGPVAEAFKRSIMVFRMRWECVLMDTELVKRGSEFYIGQSLWLMELLNSAGDEKSDEGVRRQQDVLSQIPEFTVRDAGDWFYHTAAVCLQIHPHALQGIELTPFVDSCVLLLRRRDLLSSPIACTNLIKALYSFIAGDRRKTLNDGSWNQSWGSSALACGEVMVFSCPAVKDHLAEALLNTYIQVDVVEGLDVSKDDFDKFAARSYIGRLLERMWERQETKESILRLCGSDTFQGFLGGLLDFMLFPQHEAFKQLASIKKLEKEMANTESWEALPPAEKDEKTKLLQMDKTYVKLNNRSVSDLLKLIDLITAEARVAACFSLMPFAQRAANTFLEFFENLCGPKASEHKVKDMDQYNFDPKALLATTVTIMMRIVAEDKRRSKGGQLQDGFISSVATNPNYSTETMDRALKLLQSGKVLVGEGSVAEDFETLILEITVLQAETSKSSKVASTGTPDWEQKYRDFCVNEDELDEQYKQQMTPLMYGQASILDGHIHRAKAQQSGSATGAKVKRIAKEVASWMQDLPMSAQAAVFVRQDSRRMDVVRCLVTGPLESPYALGCFMFDVYFPSTYPQTAVVIKHLTTGNNTVRFSHNLYEDGKVCLSLLGFTEGSETEKWMPDKSSLYQVLLSIQSIILIKDPMYRDPRFEGIRDLEEGKIRSQEYNTYIRINSLRYCMLELLKRPYAGFEVVTRNHFRIVKHALLKLCCDWLAECPDVHEERKMRRVIEELVVELEKLGDELEVETTDSDSEEEDD